MTQDKPKGIVVSDLDVASAAFLRGDDILPKENKLVETAPNIPLEWHILRSTIRDFYDYQEDMDKNFPDLNGCEIAFMNGFRTSAPTTLSDAIIFYQHNSEGEVIYNEMEADEVYQRIEKRNAMLDDIITIGGVTHIHPEGVFGPSEKDMEEFEKRTKYNMDFQNFFGWVDVSEEFSKCRFKGGIKSALANKDAVIVSTLGKPHIYTKVRYGYSLFIILPRNSENYWTGIGEAKEYAFNIKPAEYRLLKPKDGVKLQIIEDNRRPMDPNKKHFEINNYLKRMGFVRRGRDFISQTISSIPYVQMHPEIANKIEKEMPTTAAELMSLWKDFLRFDKSSHEAQAIRTVHTLFSHVYSAGAYDSQMLAAKKILFDMSPAYKRAEDIKNGGKDA